MSQQQHLNMMDPSMKNRRQTISSSSLSDHHLMMMDVHDEMEVTLSCFNYGITTTLLKENSDIESTRQFLISEVIDDPSVDTSRFVIVFRDTKTNKDIKITSNTQYKLLWKKLLVLPPEQREIDLMDREQYISSVNQSREYFFSPTTSRSFSTPTKSTIPISESQSPYSNSQHSIPQMPLSIPSLTPPHPPPPQINQTSQSPIHNSQLSNNSTSNNSVPSPVIHATVKTRTKKRQARPVNSPVTPKEEISNILPPPPQPSTTEVTTDTTSTLTEDSQEMVSPSTTSENKEVFQQAKEEEPEQVPVKSRQARRQVHRKVKIEPVEEPVVKIVEPVVAEMPTVSEDEVEVIPKKQRQARRKTISKPLATTSTSTENENSNKQEKEPFEAPPKKQKVAPKIFHHHVEVFSRKHECDTIINFIQNCYEELNPEKNVLFIYGTNGQGKTMVTTSIYEACSLEKYQLNLAGYGPDFIERLYGQVFPSKTTKPKEKTAKLIEHFNRKQAPTLILLDEFSKQSHSTFLEKIREANVVILAITNDPPNNSVNFLAFNQYEQDDITSILVHEYESKIKAELIQKMMGLLKNKHDMRQIKSFVETYLIPIADTLDMSKLIKLVNAQFSRKLDLLKGLGQTTIEVLVVLCCVGADKENFNGEITAEEFRRKYEEILDYDFISSYTEIIDSTEKLVQENCIVKQGITGDIILNISPDIVLNSDNKHVKEILSNRKQTENK